MVAKTKIFQAIVVIATTCYFCPVGQAQVFYPNQPNTTSIRYGVVQSYAGPTVISGNRCGCGCGGQSGCVENPGNCDLQIIPGVCKGCKTTQPIHVIPPKDCEGTKITKKFYERDIPGEGTTMVPTKVSSCEEIYRFEKKTYSVCGCTIRVCVPCAIDTITSDKCEPMPKKVNIVARVRTGTNRADIWANGVPGLPSQAVLGTNLTSAEANAKFGSTFSY